MNLTLTNSHNKHTGIVRETSLPSSVPYSKPPETPVPQLPPHTCGAFLFRLCVDQDQIGNSDNSQIFQGNRLAEKSNSQQVQEGNQKLRSVHSKRKISLSLCHSQSNFRTPKKKSVQISTNINSQSRNKRIKTHAGHGQIPPSRREELIRTDIGVRVNSAQQRHRPTVNLHQMRESMKPFTSLKTPPNHSTKKSVNSSSKKPKLTLSSSFKSQLIVPVEMNRGDQREKKDIVEDVEKQKEGTGSWKKGNQQVFEDSFMTVKLANIYGEINGSADCKAPESNIVFYNRIMAKEQWKRKEQVPEISNEQEQINRYPEQTPWNISQRSSNCHLQSSSDLAQQQAQANQQSRPLLPFHIKDRRWIGDYAPTIKTFNNSESKSDQQSVVIGRGPRGSHNAFPPITFQRGSVKDYEKQPGSQQIRRGCTSFGGEEGASTEQQGKDRFREWLSHPIEEDIAEKEY